MLIQVTEKLRPFSHVPGASCVVPGTCEVIEAFPTLLRVGGHEVQLPLTGPVEGFTLLQDLEKHAVFVFGRAKEGFFRLRIEGSDAGFQITQEKGPVKSVHIEADLSFAAKAPFERLFLGSHKAQEWEGIWKRLDLKEVLPILFCLGQKTPLIAPQPRLGTARLLQLPVERSHLEPALISFLRAAFTKMLVPRLFDDQYQGLVPDEAVHGNPFFLIQESSKLIRSFFFQQNERRLALLPHLPISLDSGKFIGLQAPGIGQIDLEWSKKRVRRAMIKASTSGEVLFDLQKEIKTFRAGKKRQQKTSEPLLLEAGKTYLLDRFQT